MFFFTRHSLIQEPQEERRTLFDNKTTGYLLTVISSSGFHEVPGKPGQQKAAWRWTRLKLNIATLALCKLEEYQDPQTTPGDSVSVALSPCSVLPVF